MLLVSTFLTFGIVVFLVYALIKSIQSERRRSGLKRILPNFSLGIILCVLFLLSWFAQGLSEWQSFVSEQRAHGEAVTIKGFVTEFSQSTLENWQSEFLQLFSFVVLAALYLHRRLRMRWQALTHQAQGEAVRLSGRAAPGPPLAPARRARTPVR